VVGDKTASIMLWLYGDAGRVFAPMQIIRLTGACVYAPEMRK
jgi:hypothetical protein